MFYNHTLFHIFNSMRKERAYKEKAPSKVSIRTTKSVVISTQAMMSGSILQPTMMLQKLYKKVYFRMEKHITKNGVSPKEEVQPIRDKNLSSMNSAI